MRTEDCAARQVAAGDQVWRSDALGRGFVQAVARDLLGRVVITWHDETTSTHRPTERMVRKEV